MLLAERLAHFAGIGAGLAGGLLVLDADKGHQRLDLLLAAGRTSVAETMAPSRRAVAIACNPATPAPITKRRAGGTVPAAVIIIGKPRWKARPP